MQAKELTSQIRIVFGNYPIEVVEGQNSICVVPKDISKEKLVRELIEKELSTSTQIL